jgi:hypothetical protein
MPPIQDQRSPRDASP